MNKKAGNASVKARAKGFESTRENAIRSINYRKKTSLPFQRYLMSLPVKRRGRPWPASSHQQWNKNDESNN